MNYESHPDTPFQGKRTTEHVFPYVVPLHECVILPLNKEVTTIFSHKNKFTYGNLEMIINNMKANKEKTLKRTEFKRKPRKHRETRYRCYLAYYTPRSYLFSHILHKIRLAIGEKSHADSSIK